MVNSVTEQMPKAMAATAPAHRQTDNQVAVYLCAALIYVMLLPPQLSVTIGVLHFPIYRFFLLAAFVYLVAKVLQRRLKLVAPDLLVILACGWIWLASYMSSGLVTTSMEQGGSHTIDIGVAYFFARVTIQSPRDLRQFLVLIAPGIALMSVIVFLEAVTHTYFVQNLASGLTGRGVPLRPWDIRLGFTRGAAGFPHPILAGIFLASFFPIYMMSGLRGWPKWFGIGASLGAFFTMSSAALLGLLANGALRAYDWVAERIANVTWKILIAVSAIIFIIVELFSDRGFYQLLIAYASLNTASAYNRVHIWNFGTENVVRNPWFGIGYDDWDRPSWMHSGSFDHFWLLMSLRFGIPASLLLVAATLTGIYLIARKSTWLAPADARLLRGVAISMGVFALGVNSASLWQAPLVWYFMLLGLTVSLGSLQIASHPASPAVSAS